MENKFKVGQKVRVIGGYEAHRFMANSIITITHSPLKSSSYYQAKGTSKLGDGQISQYMMGEQMEEIVELDFDLPLFTTEGTPVEYVSHRGRDPKFPVLAYEGKAKKLSKFTVDGIHSSGEARRNLTNTEVKPNTQVLTGYVNVYKNDDGTLRSGGLFENSPFKAPGAVGCVKVTFTAVEGVFEGEAE